MRKWAYLYDGAGELGSEWARTDNLNSEITLVAAIAFLYA